MIRKIRMKRKTNNIEEGVGEFIALHLFYVYLSTDVAWSMR